MNKKFKKQTGHFREYTPFKESKLKCIAAWVILGPFLIIAFPLLIPLFLIIWALETLDLMK